MIDVPLIEEEVKLNKIYAEIERQVTATREARPAWPCRAGCDTCCCRLARPMAITAAEWHRLRSGLEQLPATVQETIGRKIMALAEWEDGPVVCAGTSIKNVFKCK